MTVTIFLASLCGGMFIGMPVAFALLLCGVSLMLYLGMFDTHILAQNLISGADNFGWPCWLHRLTVYDKSAPSGV